MKKLVLVFICLLPVFTCQGEIIIVDNDGSADFRNIQDAINASRDGDIIVVRAGTYNENIFFNGRVITLTSENPDDPSVVQSTIITTNFGYSMTFDFGEGSDSVLTGFTITGRGIFCYATSPTILKNIIRDCDSTGIYGGNGAAPAILNNTITSNSQGGIYNCDGRITDNIISHNNGSGIVDCDGPIINNIISSNSNGLGGGLQYCYGEVRDNVIENNYAALGGGALYGCYGRISNNIIVRNKAGSEGGGLSNCYGDINNNIIAGNKCQNGGGLYGCSGPIRNNTIVGNIADQRGGGLSYCTGSVLNNIIAYNKANFVGGISGPCNNSYNAFWFNTTGNFGGGATSGTGDFIANPLFATEGFWDPNGTPNESDDFWVDGDYHVKSEAGRWDSNKQLWVIDDTTSPCVDAGNPNSDWTGELWPHGKRINLGAYGGTPQASMSLSDLGDISDLNNDGWIDYRDMNLLTRNWLSNEVLLPEDLNRDAVVDFVDFAVLTENWQPPIPAVPPIPNPMTWATPPYATSPYSIAMIATIATSTDSSGVEYFFENISIAGHDSDWQGEPNYIDTGLSPLTTYQYKVKARNKSNLLETDWSELASVTTPTDDTTPPSPNPMQWAASGEPKEIKIGTGSFDFYATMTAAEATDGSGVVEYFFQCTTEPRFSSSWQTDRTYTVQVGRVNQRHRFQVKARDLFGNETGWSTELPSLP